MYLTAETIASFSSFRQLRLREAAAEVFSVNIKQVSLQVTAASDIPEADQGLRRLLSSTGIVVEMVILAPTMRTAETMEKIVLNADFTTRISRAATKHGYRMD